MALPRPPRDNLTAIAEQRRDVIKQYLASLGREAELFASARVHIAGEMEAWFEGDFQNHHLAQDLAQHFGELVEADL